MSAQWIRLTGKDGADVYVNMSSATMMRPRKHWTRIWFMGARDDHVDVFESPTEIVISLDEMLARHAAPLHEPDEPIAPLPPIQTHVEPVRQAPVARQEFEPQPLRTAINGAAAKLARVSAIKVSRPVAEPPPEAYGRPQMSETVAEQRDQRARRRASAIMDQRRQELARKLEAMKREKEDR